MILYSNEYPITSIFPLNIFYQMQTPKDPPPIQQNNGSPQILIAGSLYGAEGGAKAGGTVILLKCLIDELEDNNNVSIQIIDTSLPMLTKNLPSEAIRGLRFIAQCIKHIHHCDIVTLHATSDKLWFTGSVITMITFLAKKPLVVRKFGGTDYDLFPKWKRRLTKLILRKCDLYLAETMALYEAAHKRDGFSHCRWFPTHRPMVFRDAEVIAESSTCRRFIYVGQVRECKGIIQLVEAAKLLLGAVIIDVYGPQFNDIPLSIFDQNPRISFKGPIAHVDVIPTMKQYDAFVFPTHHEGEGYPGVILEAYNAGLPVIASDWRAIPEIVDEDSGILVRPKDPGALSQAMQTLADDPELFTRLRHGAREKANQFSSAYWAEKFFEYCIETIS